MPRPILPMTAAEIAASVSNVHDTSNEGSRARWLILSAVVTAAAVAATACNSSEH